MQINANANKWIKMNQRWMRCVKQWMSKAKKAEYVYFDLSGQDVLKSIYSNNR